MVASLPPRRALPLPVVVSIPFIAGQWSLLAAEARVEAHRTVFQSPSLRGSGRFPRPRRGRVATPNGFQSPSLRGSGRFGLSSVMSSDSASGFNPLHCGAVVASSSATTFRSRLSRFQSPSLRGSGRFPHGGRGQRRTTMVSIPFIAGQWSLPSRRTAGGQGRKSFNPLHCGAVVASSTAAMALWWAALFQSPSLRGSGRFRRGCGVKPPRLPRFNPLHCGAVVASRVTIAQTVDERTFQSPSLRGSGRFGEDGPRLHVREAAFQSPSLRGSGRFRARRTSAALDRLVSIPFIAGQWSLRRPASCAWRCGWPFQSPSLRGSGRFQRRSSPRPRSPYVSIPFIAGQWSLRGARQGGSPRTPVSIPFIAGQWSLREARGAAWRGPQRVSIPFIAGQWSLRRTRTSRQSGCPLFQSPSLRGSGRFAAERAAPRRAVEVSIPFIAGQWSLRDGTPPSPEGGRVSIPFIAGQWSLQALARNRAQEAKLVSIPFIAGQWSLHRAQEAKLLEDLKFQSPSLRGSGRFRSSARCRRRFQLCFNPLHCGAVVASE